MEELGLNTILLTDREVEETRALIAAAITAVLMSDSTDKKKLYGDLVSLLDNFLIPLSNEK